MIREAFGLALYDLRQWFRRPILVVMGVAPLVLELLCIGGFLVEADSVPTGIFLSDDDPLAVEIRDYAVTMRSGTGLPWFTVVEGDEAVEAYRTGRVLCLISVPPGASKTLNGGGVVYLSVEVNNINDDVSKNIRQRLELLCNHFNRGLDAGGVSYRSSEPNFMTVVPVDVSFIHYVVAGVLVLAVQLSGGVNVALVTSREFEQGTVKELVMAASIRYLMMGKVISGMSQTITVFVALLALIRITHGFTPACGYPAVALLGVFGMLCFSSLGVLAASKIRRTVPTALFMILVNMVAWWIGGGLVPSEIWSGRLIGLISSLLPQTYYYRSFTNLALTGMSQTIALDLTVSAIFGMVVTVAAFLFFRREATRI